MALMTPQEYIESLRKLNTRVYMFGEKIENWVDHPMIRPSINCVAMTYAHSRWVMTVSVLFTRTSWVNTMIAKELSSTLASMEEAACTRI